MKIVKRRIKQIISLLVVIIILSSIFAIPASASVFSYSQRQRFGAMIASALTALNITLSSTLAPVQNMMDYVGDTVGLSYPFVQTWDNDYLDRSTIEIWEDYTVIDGIPYTDIWLSNEAAEKFRTDGFDFATAYSLVSNTNGTFASGWGNVDGVPIYQFSANDVRSQDYITASTGSYQSGDILWSAEQSGTRPNNWTKTIEFSSGNIATGDTSKNNNQKGFAFQVKKRTGSLNTFDALLYNIGSTGTYSNALSTQVPSALVDNTPFDYDYTTGTIPADIPLPSTDGMMIRVPTSEVDDWITDNPNMVNTPVNIDVTLDPTITTKINDLIDLILPIIPIINSGDIYFGPNHEEPVPPVPDTLLPDTYWSQLSQKLDQIINTIQNYTPDFSTIISTIQTIPSTIATWGQSIINSISSIPQAISNLGDTILQDIEQGPIKVIDKALDLLKSIFTPILLLLKNAIGIWHYVVTWVSNITAPFTWIMGIVSSTSSIIMSPIYACIAGFIVIMVYKRFGR